MEVNTQRMATIHHCSMFMPMRATGRAPVSNLILTVLHFFGHALLVGLVHWVLEHQTGEVCLQPL